MSDGTPFLRVAADRIGAPGSARIAGKNAIPRHQRRQLVLNHPDRREDGCHSKANCTSSGFESHSTGWEVSIWVIPIQYLLDWCEQKLSSEDEGFVAGVLSAQDILLAVWIMFIDNRPLRLEWRSGTRPKMVALHARLGSRTTFEENPILWWEPGVTGYEGETPIYGET